MPRHLVSLSLILLLLPPPARGQGGGAATETSAAPEAADAPFVGADRLEPEALVEAVLERNPEVAAARQALAAARARHSQVTALDDPMVSYEVAPLSIGAADVRFGQAVRLEQRLPYPGTLRRRGEIAAAEAEGAAGELAEVRLELATAAATLFADYYLVDRALRINQEHVALLEELKELATARYAAGLSPQHEPLQAEAELAHLLHDGVILDSQREILRAEINTLLHRPPAAPLPPPAPLIGEEGRHGGLPPTAAPLEDLTEQALAARPELRSRAAEIRAEEAEVDLAELQARPDFGVMGSYNSMWMDTGHQWMVGISLNLPLRRQRLAAARAEAEARAGAARSRMERAADLVRYEVKAAAERLAEGHHVLELYRSRLLPAAGDQVTAALAGFRSGAASFLPVLEAERNLRDVELGYERALAGLARRRAELDRALGRAPGRPALTEPAEPPGGTAPFRGVEP